MTASPGTFRWIITLLTAVCLPLCCCSLDSVFKGCDACDGEHASCHAPHHDDDEGQAVQSTTHDRHGNSADQQSPLGHHQKDAGCRCGGDKKISTIEGKGQHTFQPLVLAYTLPDPAALQLPSGRLTGILPDCRAPLRPAQTLLRQHCALIV